MENGIIPNFQKLRVKAIGYDEKGRVVAVSCRTPNAFENGKFNENPILKISNNLKSAHNCKIEVSLATNKQLLSNGSCYSTCTDDAIRKCGQGKLNSTQCTPSAGPDNTVTCNCDISCKDASGIVINES